MYIYIYTIIHYIYVSYPTETQDPWGTQMAWPGFTTVRGQNFVAADATRFGARFRGFPAVFEASDGWRGLVLGGSSLES